MGIIKNKNKTFIRYFISYFLISTVIFFAFLIVTQYKFQQVFDKSIEYQNETTLEKVESLIKDTFIEINQASAHLLTDVNLILSRYTNDDFIRYLAAIEIKQFLSSKLILNDIVYIDLNKHDITSTHFHIKYQDDDYYIYYGDKFIRLPIEDWNSSNSPATGLWQDGDESLFLYVPSNTSENYLLFYIINEYEFRKLLETAIPFNITSIGLMNEKGSFISSIGEEEFQEFLPYLQNKEPGNYNIDKNRSLYVNSPIVNNYRIAAISTNKPLIYLEEAIGNTYFIFVIIGFLAFASIYLAMNLTFKPLHNLVKKLSPDYDSSGEYLEQITEVFKHSNEEKQQLENKVDSYRTMMQKSIVDSVITKDSSKTQDSIEQIEQFFNVDKNNYIFMIKILVNKNITLNKLKDYILRSLPQNSSCIILESTKEDATLLVNYPGNELYKKEVISLLFHDLYDSTGSRCAISKHTDNPMDIPSLYENTLLAFDYDNSLPVVFYNDVANQISTETTFSYPYKMIETLSKELENLEFTQAKTTLMELFDFINAKNNPDFFIHSIIIDILALMVNMMSKSDIKFETYNKLYFESLYYCRSHEYEEKQDDIIININKMLSIFEEEVSNDTTHIHLVKDYILKNYQSFDLCITTIADKFNVSVAYMSYLFKEKTGENLSDYIWNLRLEKAKDLLTNTDMPIEHISAEVGYQHSSSFRRKFKQAMDVSPSQYRDKLV